MGSLANHDQTSQLTLKLIGTPGIFFEQAQLANISAKAFALLAYLSLHSRSFTRKEVSELLWSTASSASLRVALSELRSLPDSDSWLETKGQKLRVRLKSDVSEFERAVKQQAFREALEHWHFFSDEDKTFMRHLDLKKADDYMHWLEFERGRLREQYLEALHSCINDLESQGDLAEALHFARLLVEQDGLNEDAWRSVIRLEHTLGNTDASFEAFETLRQLLQIELGVEPLQETLDLLAEIEQGSNATGKKAVFIEGQDVIPNMPEQLFGRANIIEQLEKEFMAHNHILLQGFGGTGKTALAATFVSLWLEKYQGSVLWLQAGSDPHMLLFDEIAKGLGEDQEYKRSKDKSSFIATILSQRVELLVLDDVWNAYALSKLREVLPENLQVLVTARQRYPNLARIYVGNIDDEASLSLLQYLAPDSIDLENEGSELCKLLGHHPFAIRIAGISINVNQLTARELLAQIRESPHTMKVPADFAEEGRESVASLLQVSTQALSDAAYEALMAFGVMSSNRCTAELLAFCTRRSENDTENAFIELQRQGLAERQTEAGSDIVSYQLHDLIYSFSRANNNLRDKTMRTASMTFLEKHANNFEVLDSEIRNLLGAAQLAEKADTQQFITMLELLVLGNAYFQARSHNPLSLTLVEKAANEANKQNMLMLAHKFHSKIGNYYRESNDYDRALSAYKQALNLADKLDNKPRQAVLNSVLGFLLFQLEEPTYFKHFEVANQLADQLQDDLVLHQVLHDQGFVAGLSQDDAKARQLFEASIAVLERLRANVHFESKDHFAFSRQLFFALFNLGVSEHKLKSYDHSFHLLNRALDVAKELKNELWQAYTYQEMGELFHMQNERTKAQTNFDQALELYILTNSTADTLSLSSMMKDNKYNVIEA